MAKEKVHGMNTYAMKTFCGLSPRRIAGTITVVDDYAARLYSHLRSL